MPSARWSAGNAGGRKSRPCARLSAALDLTGATRDAFFESARSPAQATAVDELIGGSLPVPMTALLGRDSDVKALRQWLADPAARLITLIGPGGVGKTRLALELARATADEGATRVIFVPLGAVRDAAFVESAIAEAFGLVDVTRARFAEPCPSRLRESPHAAGARQFRACVGRGAAGRRFS